MKKVILGIIAAIFAIAAVGACAVLVGSIVNGVTFGEQFSIWFPFLG